jgi:uncharacterized membrane protein YcjF (UPF0283 family)
MPPIHDRLALLARAVRVALVVYLSPVILAVLTIGLVAMAVARLSRMMATVPPWPPALPPRMSRP